MAIIEAKTERGFRAGHFLAHEDCERKTFDITTSEAKALGDGTYLASAGDILYTTSTPSGGGDTVYTFKGIVYEDVVFTGKAIISVVTKGSVILSKLTDKGSAPSQALKTALASSGMFDFVTEGQTVRPFVED